LLTLHENLHTTTKTENQVEGRFLLDVVVAQRPSVLELLASKDKALLVGRDALLVLDLGLDVVDRVGGLDFEGDLREGARWVWEDRGTTEGRRTVLPVRAAGGRKEGQYTVRKRGGGERK
jgi:hypothetical protein